MIRRILFLILLSTHSLSADDILEVRRLTSPIQFDGWVEEEEWGHIEVFDLKMQVPNLNAEPTEITEIRLAYDDEYIYLAGRMFESDIANMMANTKKRDALTGSTQWFGMVLDTYNDNENALAFFTTPTGVRWDLAVANDAVGSSPTNIDWNTFWDVRVQQTDEGWFVEMRVPFSSIGFEDKDGTVTMGLVVWRYIARKNEVDMYPLIPPDYGDWSAFRPSLFTDIQFTGIKRKRPFFVTPYVLGGYSKINDLSENETQYVSENNFLNQIGGDIKLGLSRNWTLDLSVNTDFAQVEADDQQVNLTRFSLFFPEKRLFFQERAGVFNFGFGRRDQLFYSRRIGINEGEIQSIIGGARVVGRTGAWDIGFLNMQTASNDDFMGENMTVVRAKRDIINQRSDIGFMLTNRVDFNGAYNTNYGLDFNWEAVRDHFVNIRVAQTFDDAIENKIFSPRSSKYWFSYSMRRQRGFSFASSLSRSGEDHLPELGFEQRDNYWRIGNRILYNWFQGDDSKIFKHGLQSGGSIHWSNETGKIESLSWRAGWNLQLKNTWNFDFRFRPQIENLVEDFELSDDVIIPVGDYKFLAYNVRVNTPMSNKLLSTFEIDFGNFYDGKRTGISVSPTYNVSSTLELSASYEFNRAVFDQRDQVLNLHLVRLRSLIMFDTKLSLATLIQYNNQSKSFQGNIRFRYNPSEGNDLFIVYNDDLNTDRFRETPVLPATNQRSIQLKYSYTFRL